MKSLNGATALVIGFGRSGTAAATYLRRHGCAVRVVDQADSPGLRARLKQAGLPARLGGYSEEDLAGVDVVVVSPGVPWDLPLLEEARRREIEVTSEIDLFFRACPCPIAGITGTNGKTTTTALTAEVFRAGGLKVMRGGNIGEPVLDRLDELTPDSWVVLELSSFQLESMARPRLHVGAILNVTPDHLDRHHTFARYVDMKARAVEAMTPEDTALLNFDDEVCRGMVSRTRGRLVPFSIRREDTAAIFTEDGWICIRSRLSGAPNRVLRVADVPLPGEHNLSNCLAAVGVGTAAEIPLERIAEAVRTFKGVEHRLELVGSFGGVRWYNDSKATNPDSTLKALSAFSEPMVLIAGGRNKGIDLEPLARAIAGRVAALVVIGETGDELARLVRKAGLNRTFAGGDLRQAVRLARHEAVAGGVVVLSPGFASFDMFRDFEDRGRQFKAAVRAEAGG